MVDGVRVDAEEGGDVGRLKSMKPRHHVVEGSLFAFLHRLQEACNGFQGQEQRPPVTLGHHSEARHLKHVKPDRAHVFSISKAMEALHRLGELFLLRACTQTESRNHMQQHGHRGHPTNQAE